MKALIRDERVTVYRNADLRERLDAELTRGAVVELGRVSEGARGQAVEVLLPRGERGYISGDIKIVSFSRVILRQDEAPVYRGASAQSEVTCRLRKGCEFQLADKVTGDDGEWVRILDPQGCQGVRRHGGPYMDGG